MNEEAFFLRVKDTVLAVDRELFWTCGKGVLFAPELFLAFTIGKDIAHTSQAIFGGPIEWLRETSYLKAGPTDCVFELAEHKVFLEFKLKSRDEDYFGDIEKLARINPEHIRLFCVLANSFQEESDNRLANLESRYRGRIAQLGLHVFHTWDSYKRKVFCHLALYRVLFYNGQILHPS